MNNGRVAVAQRTRNHLGASGSWGSVVGTKAVVIADHEEDDIVMVPMSRKWLADGVARIFAAGEVETLVSQETGPRLPLQEMQSVPILIPPNPEGDDGLYSSYAHVKVAADDKDARTSRPRSDEEPHMGALKYHLHERLEATGRGEEPADVEVLLDPGARVTGVSQDVCLRLQQLWTREQLDRPYIGGMNAQVAGGLWVTLICGVPEMRVICCADGGFACRTGTCWSYGFGRNTAYIVPEWYSIIFASSDICAIFLVCVAGKAQ